MGCATSKKIIKMHSEYTMHSDYTCAKSMAIVRNPENWLIIIPEAEKASLKDVKDDCYTVYFNADRSTRYFNIVQHGSEKTTFVCEV